MHTAKLSSNNILDNVKTTLKVLDRVCARTERDIACGLNFLIKVRNSQWR